MKNILSKLAVARLFIKSHPIKKDGRNEFSKYDYFTPEIVSKLVNDACIEANIICVFNLKQDNIGYYGEVITTDLESGESLTTEMRTAKPEIKATNETQQMGGMNTYAKRYALMSLFDIEDNTMDFDGHNNSRPDAKKEDDRPWITEKQFGQLLKRIAEGDTNAYTKADAAFKIKKEYREQLKNILKK